ncbi:MAG: diguanylate cyclase [Gammaproteobacteria bacterium]|nr:diguanylate cyclase [Rhodocyclaceae bacterium]MBU3908712.1 diguanylate cyclase [Gammaproteobacteria bacterium]MBU3988834.1 diguanylate cyclase [Gammaproteobacteria bacterium]MBU4004740.1 diguanylate cyclase [Gammaproteobacteria bacterium]MBU4021343.1 diguanylate cyclase [Gammaproteobacteria bacterium]
MPHLVGDHIDAVQQRWQAYRIDGSFDHFVEFTLSLNSLAEQLSRLRLPGLVRQCESLENAALALFGDPSTHPLAEQSVMALDQRVGPLLGAILTSRHASIDAERRMNETIASIGTPEWVRPRTVWMVVELNNGWAKGLRGQLSFYGFRVVESGWDEELPHREPPFAIIFVPSDEQMDDKKLALIQRARSCCPATQLFYVGVPRELDLMVTLMRAGIDITIQREEQAANLLSRILDFIQTREQESFKVLVVEDSRVAVAQIQRALNQNSIQCEVITDPSDLLSALDAYRPDLILMDMYMPHCNGVEATRVVRQLPAYQSIPIVYLSSETDIALQVEALRLGGDQFLTKPFNPVVLAATLKTTIERNREMQRSSRNDGLTGLLTHTAAKARLDAMLATLPHGGQLCVAMLDIDHFKSVNDSFGHPVGDQVIRSLAWLLKGRLRGSDLIGRYGGEEFVLALTDVGPDEAWVVIDRIRSDFAKLPHAHGEGSLRATFSAGIACFPEYCTSTELIHMADTALLEAKRSGRNRVERVDDLLSRKQHTGSPAAGANLGL